MTGGSTLASIMTRDLEVFAPDLSIAEAVATLLRRRISGAPVLGPGEHLVGILTAKDCFEPALHASYYEEWRGVVADFMTRSVETLDADTDIVTAAQAFLACDFRRFPVVRDGHLVGIVTRLDVLRALANR